MLEQVLGSILGIKPQAQTVAEGEKKEGLGSILPLLLVFLLVLGALRLLADQTQGQDDGVDGIGV